MEEILAGGIHWRILNFLIFIGLLFFFLRKPVRDFWESRSHQMRSDMDEAGRLKREAKEKHGFLEKRFSRIEEEFSKMVRSMEEESELEKKKMMEEASMLASHIKEESGRIAEQEVRKVRETLKAEVVQLSVEFAEKFIRENIRDVDQQKLSQEYLKGLQ